jgi:hypothetical protein
MEINLSNYLIGTYQNHSNFDYFKLSGFDIEFKENSMFINSFNKSINFDWNSFIITYDAIIVQKCEYTKQKLCLIFQNGGENILKSKCNFIPFEYLITLISDKMLILSKEQKKELEKLKQTSLF